MTTLILGFDWKDYAKGAPDRVRAKLVRDRIASIEGDIVLWGFGSQAHEGELAPNIRVLRRRGRFPRFRLLYDLIAPTLLMRDLARFGIAPSSTIIYDFPFLRAADAVKRAYGARTVLYLANLPTDLARTRTASAFKAAYHRFFERRAPALLDALVAINDTTYAYALRIGMPPERIHRISLDTISADQKFMATAKAGHVRARLSLAPDTRLILSVGRLEAEKGFDALIRAFAAIRGFDAALVIVGEGSLRPELEALARTLGVGARVHLVGSVPRSGIWEYYADADVFVLLSRSEALGLVVWEAMYARVPVIASGAGGLGESIGQDGERGYLWTEAAGISDLREKLTRCFDRSGQVPMLDRARAYVEARMDSKDLQQVLSSIAS